MRKVERAVLLLPHLLHGAAQGSTRRHNRRLARPSNILDRRLRRLHRVPVPRPILSPVGWYTTPALPVGLSHYLQRRHI